MISLLIYLYRFSIKKNLAIMILACSLFSTTLPHCDANDEAASVIGSDQVGEVENLIGVSESSINDITTNIPIETTTTTSGQDLIQTESTINDHTTIKILTTTSTTRKESAICTDVNYCLNGGTCVLNESGQMLCLCPEGFYGARCQTRNICKTIIADSLTGDQICSKINRDCVKNDKFLRCSCLEDEYFVFRSDNSKNQQNNQERPQANLDNEDHSNDRGDQTDGHQANANSPGSSNFIYSNLQSSEFFDSNSSNSVTYLAECRKIDKCLGVRCKQKSELCLDGKCVCNQPLGYIQDPADGICKLLNPCLLPQPDGQPICGKAQCYPTYDQELYNCLCPTGYAKIGTGSSKSSTQCILITDTVCAIPLLNKCQHICQVGKYPNYQNNIVCSCLPGYRAGSQVGIDDHMCFFEEPIDSGLYDDPSKGRATYQLKPNIFMPSHEYVFKPYSVPKRDFSESQEINLNATFAYDPVTQAELDNSTSPLTQDRDLDDRLETDKTPKEYEFVIKRELRSTASSREGIADEDVFIGTNLNKMSAQDRCNVFCEENKICVLEKGSKNSYKCVCDRQGYISVGDRCLDWCSAAEFSYKIQNTLEFICLSGICQKIDTKPSALDYPSTEINRLQIQSSWRPTFECNCKSPNGILVQDPETKLCKINYQAIINPCKPGNAGYIDCVEHKNAFCAVLHKPTWAFLRDLRQVIRPETASSSHNRKNPDAKISAGNAKSRAFENPYICVCSPDKKFLIDKPRNKERCVDECDLLNVECGRFNRMCRPATIAPDDFNRLTNLVRIDPDGPRLNFKRTGCECLPGFNVGPLESVDFTLDDNNNNNPSIISQPLGRPPLLGTNLVYEIEGQTDSEHFRAKYMNINSRCLLDYDVVEFHASFKAPHNFDPNWITIGNAAPAAPTKITQHYDTKDEIKAPSNIELAHRHYPNHGVEHSTNDTPVLEDSCDNSEGDCILKPPDFMQYDISELHKHVVLVAQCEPLLQSLEAFQECVKYRYWIMLKLRNHFVDWRRVLTNHLKETFDLMDGDIRLRVNKCEASLKAVSTITPDTSSKQPQVVETTYFGHNESDSKQRTLDPRLNLENHNSIIDADIDCELTLHSASDDTSPPYARKVLLEKQLQKFIFVKPSKQFGEHYYLMAPNMLIRRESFDQLANHRKLFNPCNSDYEYCDKQTKCEMVDTVNFTCTCEYGYTPIGSRDIYFEDSRKEVCEDINECLFDVCKELADVSTCINEVGDYRCQCNRHYTGDNKRYCTHVCNTIPCKQGKCRLVDDHHAFCECDEGYKEADCSVQDPNVALRKANMIIFGAIFTSILLLAITFAISLNSQLKKTKKKLKRLEAVNDTAHLFEFNHQQPFRQRMSKVSVCS